MSKAKRTVLFLLAAACLLPLCGCWDYRDIEDMSVAMGMAIDRTKDGDYLLTTEIAKPDEEEAEAYRVEAKGRTVAECMENTGKKLEKEVYWANVQVFVIGEEVAKEGLLPLVDIAERQRELRPTLRLAVSKEETARELLETDGLSTEIVSMELSGVLKNCEEKMSKASVPALYEVVSDMAGGGKDVSLPALKKVVNEDNETAELDGTAVFADKRLAGYLTDEESRALLFVQGGVKGGTLVIEDPEIAGAQRQVTLQIMRSATDIRPELTGTKPAVDVRIRAEAAVGENGAGTDYNARDTRERLERLAGEEVARSVEDLIRRVQLEYGADIFGFGSTVKDRLPGYWKRRGGGWSEAFKDLAVNVAAEVDILGSGLIKEPY